ncbi:hypothetical protein ASZ90_005694 [hydrocarbon metagenome]|uniref:Uncharacterized protein n=1 Tax=hydrocarbon metagenome TaxID=938273 RepID=A0A0W8FUI8_9ZZZZ
MSFRNEARNLDIDKDRRYLPLVDMTKYELDKKWQIYFYK